MSSTMFYCYTLILFLLVSLSGVKLEPVNPTTQNTTWSDVSPTFTTASNIPTSPIQILGKVPLRMLQGTTRPVVFGFANFLSEFYTLEITSSDRSVVRVVEDGIQLYSSSAFDEAIVLLNDTQVAINDSLAFGMTIANFTLQGVRFGKAHLVLQLMSTDTGEIDEELSEILPSPAVAVIRMPTAFDMAFGYALLVVSALTTGIMGCEIEWDRVKPIFRRPYGIIIGAGCQFIIMPLTAFVLCILFKLPNDLSLGVLLAACSPGGGMSNMTTVVVEGHLLLSIAMTFMSTCLALGMMPFNLFIYSRYFIDQSTFPIPFDKIIMGLALLLGPLSAGFLLRRCKPSLAEKILKVLKPACLVVVLFTMAGGMYTIRYVFTYIIPNMIICSFLLPVVGFILGAGTALLLRRPINEVKTISMETGIQNVAIAAGVIRLTYPYPDADMVSSTVMWTMLGQFFAVTTMMCTYTVYKRCCKKSKPEALELEDGYIQHSTTASLKKGVNGKPTIVHHVSTDDDSQFQTIHAHLARITQPKSPEYEQLPQTETPSTKKGSNGDANHGAYSRLLSSESTAKSAGPEETEMDTFSSPDDDRIDGGNDDGLWAPNPTAGKIDYKVFKDEEDE
ncbi:hepatic sodium/bile acid cotransporter-like [Amphiura filiformis]|uniref:hepatic sodium/bile acid cotransporter-like n=1 Tax=Amphiura filiformis TaxID=82378 RepID=UPI003B20E4F8